MNRPALRYHGGKYAIREWVIGFFPEHLQYVEVFGGAASVLLSKRPARLEVYNDLDKEIVDFFKVLRDPALAGELRTKLDLTPFSRVEFKRAYEVTDELVEKARRLVVRSFQGVGASGIQTEHRSGWRVRTAKCKRNAYAEEWGGWILEIESFTKRLRKVSIECMDWEKCLATYDSSDTLFYVDPPYPQHTRSASHRCVYRNELSMDDHCKLVWVLGRLEGMVVLSSYANPLYDQLCDQGWHKATKGTRTQTNAPRVEALYINPAAWQRHQGSLLSNEQH